MILAWMEVHNSSIIVTRMCSSLDGCDYCAFMMSRSDISAEEDLHGDRATTSMKKGWLYRTSYDEKNHEIAPVMIQIE